MKSWCKTLLACGLSLGLLSACSSSDVDEEPVSPLPEIEASVFPTVSWSASTGNGVGPYYSRLRPAVRYDKLYVADRYGQVTAFDEATGETVWQKDFSSAFKDNILAKNKGAQIAAGVTAARDKIFIGGESGLLGALDAETGDVEWSVIAGGELLSVPTVAEDLVVVSTSAGTLEAFNVDDGEKQWVYESKLPTLTLRGTGAANYESGGFFVGTADGKIAVVIKNSGQAAWEQAIYTPKGGNEFTRMADIDMMPLIIGDNLYAVSFNGNLVSMELRTGRVVWTRKYSSFHELADSGVNLFLVDDHSRIYSIDRRNGLENWNNTELANRDLTSPAVFHDYIVVGDFEGYLHFIDKNDGKIVGRVQVDSSGLFSQPLVVGDNIYVQTRNGEVARITLP
ncbi:outer membrane protein assembly factor BamB [Shewanella sp. D64]|uniref:outer membrane protein assembly factor BamB n=1 Tax=unclassified Shewanella TaxID=196818 RepID=UPI0022BA3CD2|nr:MULTISPECIES: outer membrane protein assembly factor BamB [unclassified Shewanella]MEC4726598.1 outer membrane protein assembly factor BamB [Shewanella sp. D64]MEC4737361.1 outer membrane protein assembly factor BamB [Shewanella sp. E94]WBJ97183.1 outer membrane protein assembly factor BamB [Shewanella sp. MTB7]